MFRKPIKIKSNSQVKGSERKAIKENVSKAFPFLSENDIENIFPKKDNLNSIKIVTSNGEVVQLYTVQKRPLIFYVRGTLFPTIYLLWEYPTMIPAFTTHSKVLQFLTSGADLMLPGVIPPPNLIGVSKYGSVQEGAIAYVNLSDNKAAIAVGTTAQSAAEMIASNGKGKCLTVFHTWGDKLCTLEGIAKIPLEKLGPPDFLKLQNYEKDFPALDAKKEEHIVEPVIENVIQGNQDIASTDETEKMESAAHFTTSEVDEFLDYCFFTAIKYSKTLILPILTSNFFKLQMIPLCPMGKTIDIKKSSFKKLKTYLDSMCKEGLITVKEVKKGVESITAVNKDHPRFCEFYVEPQLRPKRPDDTSNCPSTSVTESYAITPIVLPLFEKAGHNKGDVLQMSEIRPQVVNYVKNNECQVEGNERLIKPKEALIKICKTENNITWEELMEKVCQSMKTCFKVTTAKEEVLNKGKVSPITMTISQRSGNKKVTLIDNLELFGIHVPDFAKECQHGVAASTSISKPPGKKYEQLLVQGNQILFVHSLLTVKYKIPSKYIRGLEYAPKKKK